MMEKQPDSNNFGFAGNGYDEEEGGSSGSLEQASNKDNSNRLTKYALQTHTNAAAVAAGGAAGAESLAMINGTGSSHNAGDTNSIMNSFPFSGSFIGNGNGSDTCSLGMTGFIFGFDNDEMANGYGSNGSNQSAQNNSRTSTLKPFDVYNVNSGPQPIQPQSQSLLQQQMSSSSMKPSMIAMEPLHHQQEEQQRLQKDNSTEYDVDVGVQDQKIAQIAEKPSTESSKVRRMNGSSNKRPPVGEHLCNDKNGSSSNNVNVESDKVSTKNGRSSKKMKVVSNASVTCSSSTAANSGKSKSAGKSLGEQKREERNLREKERSLRISEQINELRDLLMNGGVVIPKGTKSSVLTEAANYIRLLQQHQYRSEMDRYQLVQQMQKIGAGVLGPQAAQAVRHVASQNGVWSLGNFGGLPPRAAAVPQPTHIPSTVGDPRNVTSVKDSDYRQVFNMCGAGMAIASMGGAFVDCNDLFCQLSQYTKQELCAMTIFNVTSRDDLQIAFDVISSMISPANGNSVPPENCILRGSMKSRDDFGLSVTIIRSEEGVAKCLCVTLVRGKGSINAENTRPATFSSIDYSRPAQAQAKQHSQLPYYTTG